MRKKLAMTCLMLSSFFLPFGYDALFKLIMDATGSYWTADIIFYCIAAVFFVAYLSLEGHLSKWWSKLRKKKLPEPN